MFVILFNNHLNKLNSKVHSKYQIEPISRSIIWINVKLYINSSHGKTLLSAIYHLVGWLSTHYGRRFLVWWRRKLCLRGTAVRRKLVVSEMEELRFRFRAWIPHSTWWVDPMDLPARTTAPHLNTSNIHLVCNSRSVFAPLNPSLRLSSINPKPENKWDSLLNPRCVDNEKFKRNYPTYIAQETQSFLRVKESSVPFSTNDLDYDYTEAKDIRFDRKYPIQCIFWWHVSTVLPTNNSKRLWDVILWIWFDHFYWMRLTKCLPPF